MSGKEAFSVLPVGSNNMSQMDFSAWPQQPSLKFTRAGSFWRLGETDASTPSCAVSLHHRQVQAPEPVGLQPTVKAECLALESALPFHPSLSGDSQADTKYCTEHTEFCSPPAFAENKRFSSSCSRQKAECGQAVTAEAGRPSCMQDAERPKKGRNKQAGWHNRWGDRHEPDPGQAG